MLISIFFVIDFENSAVVFNIIRENDPYCLCSIDVYSHVLFVMV